MAKNNKNLNLTGGGWFSDQSLKRQQQVLSNIPGHTETILADQKRRTEEAKRKKAEQAQKLADEMFAAEQRKMQEEAAVKKQGEEKLKQQEAAYQAEEQEKKLAPKNFVEQSVQEVLGKESPKFFDYKKEKEELEKLNQMTFAGKRNKFYEESKKQLFSVSDTDNWLKSVGKKTANMAIHFGNTVTSFTSAALAEAFERGFTPEEEKRYQQLQDKINKVETPIKKQQQADIIKERDTWKAKAEPKKKALQQQLLTMQNDARMKTPADYELEQKLQDELLQMKHIEENYEDAIDRYEDGINSNGYDFWKGLARDAKSTLTLGLTDIDNVSTQAMIVDKLKRIEKGAKEELSETEQDLLNSAIIRNGAESAGVTGEYYDLGDGVRQSAMFMAEMALVSRLTGGVSATASKMLQGSNALVRGGASLLGEAAAATVMPSTSIKGLDSYSNSLQQQTDENGNKSFIVSDAAKLAKAKDIKKRNTLNKKLISDAERKAKEYFEDNGEPNPELEAEVEKLYNIERRLEAMASELVDKDGEVVNKERDWIDAALTGFTSNLTERLAEKYVGAAADKGLGAAGSFLSNSKVGKAVGKSKVGSAANWVDRQIVKGRRIADDTFFDKTKAGALTRAFHSHVGPAKMMHSLPSEMIEEIAVQLTPQYMEDYNKQLDELSDPGFYKQVALSTLAIGGGSSVIGLAKHAGMYSTSADYRDDYQKEMEHRKRLKNLYRSLDEAVTDDQVANDIAMNTLGTLYSIGDYQARIEELRNKDAVDKGGKTQEEREELANQLEQKSFFNMAYQSLSTGTENDFRRALKSVAKNEKLSEETKASAKLALNKLEKLQSKHEAYRNNINFNEIMYLTLEEDIMNQTIQDQEFELEEMRVEDKWASDLDKIREKNNFEREYPLDKLSLEDLQDDDINNYVATLQAESPELKALLDKTLIVNSLKNDLAETQSKLEYETNPANAKEIKKRHEDKVVENLIAKTDSSNASQHLRLLKTSGLATPENIARINEQAINNIAASTVENDYKREEQLLQEMKALADDIERHPNPAKLQERYETYKQELETIRARREKSKEDTAEENVEDTSEENVDNNSYTSDKFFLSEEQERIKDISIQLEALDTQIDVMDDQVATGNISRAEAQALVEERDYLDEVYSELAASIKQRKANIAAYENKHNKEEQEKEEAARQAAEAKELRRQQEEQAKINKGLDENGEIIEEALSEAEMNNLLSQPRVSLNFGESSADENAADEAMENGLFAPIEFDQDSNPQRDYVEKMKTVLTNMRNKGVTPNFSGFITGLRSRLNNDAGIENLFNLLAVAYQEAYNTSLSEQDLTNVYESHFGTDDLNEFANIINNPGNVNVSTVQVQPVSTATTVVQNVHPVAVENKILDPETLDTKDPVYAKHTKSLYKDTGLKLGGVLGREYEETEDGKQTVSYTINATAIPFIDWRNFRPGSEAEFKFHIDYLLNPENILSTWENTEAQNLTGKDKPIKIKGNVRDTLLDIFHGTELNTWDKIQAALIEYQNNPSPNNPLFANEEFLKIVPIGTVNNGLTDEFDETGTPISSSALLLGGLNDNNWFNTANVALRVDDRGEPMINERQNRIDENKRINMEARQEILANGSFKTTVASKSDKEDNTRTKEDAENNFYSIVNAFGSIEEFEKHATIAIFNEGVFMSGVKNKKGIVAKIDGVPITQDKITNFHAYMKHTAEQGFQYKPIFIHKSGIDADGNYTYTLRDVISNHEAKAQELAKLSSIAGRLQQVLNDKSDPVLAKKVMTAFKNAYGFPLTSPDLVNVFRSIYPDNLRNKKGVRQDLSLKGMATNYEMIPDFSSFKNGDEFIEALLMGEREMPKINKKELVYNNFHTNLIFTPITKNGETIYTEHAQPFAMFDYKGSGARVSKTSAEVTDNHRKNLENVLATAKKDLANASTTEEIKIIENKIKKVEQKLEETKQKQVAQTSVVTVPGNVVDNNDFFQNLSEHLNLGTKEDAVKMFNESLENFVNSHFDMLVDNLDHQGIIKKECK